MSHGPRYRTQLRRRREGKTDYRSRLALLKSGRHRVIVRRSLKNIRVQFPAYDERGDQIIASAIGTELQSKYNWKHSLATTPAAYLTGLLAATRAKKAGITDSVLDIGRQVPVKGSKVFAALQGVLDAGITCPCSDDKLPPEDRIMGKHLDKGIAEEVTQIKEKIIGGSK